jgi:hypothetical protein
MISDMGASSSSRSDVNGFGPRSASTATRMAERVRREMRSAWCGSGIGLGRLLLDREGSTGEAKRTCGREARSAAPTDAERVRGWWRSSMPGVLRSELLVPEELEGREKRFDGRRCSGSPVSGWVLACCLRVGVVNRGGS